MLEPINENQNVPLAKKAAPTKAESLVGQDKIWTSDSRLKKLVDKDSFHSLIFWGPPGSGKTSLAMLISKQVARPLALLSAVNHGVKDIRVVVEQSQDNLRTGDKSTLLFMDEIHRLSKSQQDVLLPAVEDGSIKFIGATTENPSFEVNAALNSRSIIFKFEMLSEESLIKIQKNAIDLFYSERSKKISDEVIAAIARSASGDARQALNLIEAIIESSNPDDQIDLEFLKSSNFFQSRRYDKKAEQHYDIISAFIKSIRASKPEAAVYYLARMLAGGEDPNFIARRMVILASEDIGLADATALPLAQSALAAVHQIGMPEARIILAHACVHLALAPKSNKSYKMLLKAEKLVDHYGDLEIPLHLRNAPTKLMKEMGYGKDYVYAHDNPELANQMNYLPEALIDRAKIQTRK